MRRRVDERIEAFEPPFDPLATLADPPAFDPATAEPAPLPEFAAPEPSALEPVAGPVDDPVVPPLPVAAGSPAAVFVLPSRIRKAAAPPPTSSTATSATISPALLFLGALDPFGSYMPELDATGAVPDGVGYPWPPCGTGYPGGGVWNPGDCPYPPLCPPGFMVGVWGMTIGPVRAGGVATGCWAL